MSIGQTHMNTAAHATVAHTFTAEDTERLRSSLADSAARTSALAALPPCPENRNWRVFREGTDIGVAFSLDAASEAVRHLRAGHWKPAGRLPRFHLAAATVRGARAFERCVVAR
jgi:hypothetical protein